MVAYLRATIKRLENLQAGQTQDVSQGVDALVKLVNDLVAAVDYHKSCLEHGKGRVRRDIKALKVL